MKQAGTIQVGLVEIQTVFRAGFEALLKSDPALRLQNSESDLTQLLECRDAQLDVVVIGVGSRSRLEDVRRLAQSLPSVAPVVFVPSDRDPGLRDALLAGARGYIRSDSEGEDIVEVVKAAGRGKCLHVPIEPLLQILGAPPQESDQDSESYTKKAFARLTDREREVLVAMSTGNTYRHIAARLKLAPSTVKKYAQNVIMKLGASNRSTAVIQAYRSGLLEQ